MASENAEDKRLYYVDWLRVLVVLTLIPFHAALTRASLPGILLIAGTPDGIYWNGYIN